MDNHPLPICSYQFVYLILMLCGLGGLGDRSHSRCLGDAVLQPSVASTTNSGHAKPGFLYHWYPYCAGKSVIAASDAELGQKTKSYEVLIEAACHDYKKANTWFGAGEGTDFDKNITKMCNELDETLVLRNSLTLVVETFELVCEQVAQALTSHKVDSVESVRSLHGRIMDSQILKESVVPKQKPVALIMLGPPASGKSKGSVGKSLTQLSPPFMADEMHNYEFAEVTIDDVMDLVEPYHSETKFRQGVWQLLQDMKSMNITDKNNKGIISVAGMEESSESRDRSDMLAAKKAASSALEAYLAQLSKTMFGDGSKASFKASEYNKFRSDLYVDDVNNGAMGTALAMKIPFMYETTFTGDWALAVDVPKMRLAGFRIEAYYPIAPPDVLVNRAIERAKTTGRMPAEAQIRDNVNECAETVLKTLRKAEKSFDALTLITREGDYGAEGEILLQWDGKNNCTWQCKNEPAAFQKYGIGMLASICEGFDKCS